MMQKVPQFEGQETDILAFKRQFTLTPLPGRKLELLSFTHLPVVHFSSMSPLRLFSPIYLFPYFLNN